MKRRITSSICSIMASNSARSRPALTKNLSVGTFKSYYWKKQELSSFCSVHNIPYSGASKDEITARIAHFLHTGQIPEVSKAIRVGDWDSSKRITTTTPVINFKMDKITRQYFVNEIGVKFKVNAYLRQFMKSTNDGSLTYGDLVDGYKSFVPRKDIGKQFQYNQFQRDFYANETGKTRAALNEAWEMVKTRPGPSTYAHYLQIKKAANVEKPTSLKRVRELQQTDLDSKNCDDEPAVKKRKITRDDAAL